MYARFPIPGCLIVVPRDDRNNPCQGPSPPESPVPDREKGLLGEKEIELARGKEKVEKELHLLKKKEKEERRSYLEKINKVKKERDEFAAENAALQVPPRVAMRRWY